jgi:CubicO group peptidase (beta-lactamase class C family)
VTSLADAIDAVVTEELAAGAAPGAVVLVAVDGRVVLERGWGHATDAIFDLASLTKGLATAPLLLQLVDAGAIALEDRAGLEGGGKESVTIVDLATHTSGLTDEALYDPATPLDSRTDDPWGAVRGSTLGAPPKSVYRYQDANYIALGRIVERLAGGPLDRLFATRIAAPLALRDTGFLPYRLPSTSERLVPTDMPLGVVHDPRARLMGGVAGHAGLFGTARDVWAIAQAVLDGGAPIVSPSSALGMMTPQSPPGLHPRTVGFDTDPTGTGPRGDRFSTDGFGHTGFTGTSLWVDRPTRTVVVILTSRIRPGKTGDVRALRRRVASTVAAHVLR